MAYESRYGYVRGSYNATSSAYALQPELIPEYGYENERHQKRQAQQDRAQEKKLRHQIVLHRVKLFVSLGVIFAGAFSVIGMAAMVTEQTYKNKSLNEELIALQSDNVALKAEISDKIDLDYVKNEAINRLGMAEPQAYQVAYIDVPKQSYTVQYETAKEEKGSEFSLSSIVGLFNK